MRLFIQLFIVLFVFGKLQGQIKSDYVWELGSSSYKMQDPYPNSIEMSFNNSSFTIDTIFRPLFMGYLNSSIADENGNLLLYTNGCEVRNEQHKIIDGSIGLSPGDINNEWCVQNHIGYSVFEGGLFLPFHNDSIIDLFHQRLVIMSQPLRLYVDTLFLSHFKRENGSFSLVNKAIPVLGGKISQGNLEAIKTSDDNGWWLIQNIQNTNKYYVVRIYDGEIDTITTQEIGDTTSAKGAAQSVFSPDGKMFVRFSSKDDLYLFDFDRNSGKLSNYRKIFVADTNDYSGVAFSGNSRFLYACTTLDLFQFDTWTSNVETSKIHIDHYDGYADPFPSKFYLMQLGPDCRIYICTTNGNTAWHVIQEPNEEGVGCRFEQHAIQFPVSNSITFPNFPVFRVNFDQPCDPDIATGFFQYYITPSPVDISPNPTNEALHINLSEAWKSEQNINIQIMDQLGLVWKEIKINGYENSQVIECDNLPPGLYFVQLKSEGKWWVGEFVKM